MRSNSIVLKKLIVPFTLGFGLLMTAACDREGPAERAGESIDKSVENAGEAVEDAGDRIEDEASH